MNFLIACLTQQHDLRLVVVAACLAPIGSTVGFRLLRLAALSHGARRMALSTGFALAIGVGAWTTHFVSMLAWLPGVPVRYQVTGVVVSLLVAVSGAGLATPLALSEGVVSRALAGLVMSLSLAAMHFIGMDGLLLPVAMSWSVPIAGLSIGWIMLFGVGAYVIHSRRASAPQQVAAFVALTVGIAGLHYGAMSAVQIDANFSAAALSESGRALALAVGLAASMVVLTAGLLTGVEMWGRVGALRHLRDAIDAMPDGLAIYDSDDRLRIWNSRYAELCPELAERLRPGIPFTALIDDDLARGAVKDALGREAEWRAERLAERRRLSATMEQRLSDGRWLRVQDRRTADGGVVTVVNDITDLKRNAEILSSARDAAEAANRAKSEFLANMSHEIRTPLNGVIGVAQALAATDLSDRQTEMLELIRSSGATLQTLLSDLLDLARVESGRMTLREEPIDLARAVREAADLYEASAREKGLQFFVDIAPEAQIWVEADVVRLKQILTNLVSNAVKFTAKGFVSLRVTAAPLADGTSSLRFSVEDTGVGFDAAAKARLFARFEQADGTITRRFGGTGLGLAISRQLAEMMGGQLDCESEPGGGSAFFLTVPLKTAEAPAPAPKPKDAEAPAEQALRILLADDHPTNRKVVELILAPLGVELAIAENGEQAVDLYRAQAFDVVLMDMQMPVMDGLTATRRIRAFETEQRADRTPVIMLTANALPEHVRAAHDAGADEHLAKPFSAPELIGLLAALTSDAAAESEAA